MNDFPAFIRSPDPANLGGALNGITARDYFAAYALMGIIANSSDTMIRVRGMEASEKHGETRTEVSFAREAYAIADAMMEARAK